MSERYFDKFPIITYANNQARDITERVVFTDNTLKNPYVFYPYTIETYERPDQFANRYYDDSFYSWLLYLSNSVVDPYYEWYLQEEELSELIQKKYGSYELAQVKVKYYKNNWFSANAISISEYDALPPTLFKYWEPQYGTMNNVIGYQRKKDDTEINTNNIVAYPVSNTDFMTDEIVNVYYDANTSGRGQVLFANNGYVYIQHTSGFVVGNKLSISANIAGFDPATATIFLANSDLKFDINERIYYEVPTGNTALSALTANSYYYVVAANSIGFSLSLSSGGPKIGLNDIRTNSPAEVHHFIPPYVKSNLEGYAYITSNSYIYGTESGVNNAIYSSSFYAQNLLPEEVTYFSPVTYYYYEYEKNEGNKTINVVDSTYSRQIALNIKNLLK